MRAHVDADDVVTLLAQEHCRERGIDAAAHGDEDAREGGGMFDDFVHYMTRFISLFSVLASSLSLKILTERMNC